ncbi:MAG TPA: methyltransferase [Tepidisphaeraceae bacterium]|jgi:ubiquinone/menaquinone biosynthesis C-methylase UbiE|nr:methyltransferase [Tepidisphaeraceae bacterium]
MAETPSKNQGPLPACAFDPTPLFDMVRWSHGSELLAAAVAHFDLFSRLNRQAMTLEEIARELKLAPRPANVLLVALRAMNLIEADADGKLYPSAIARDHLVPGGEFYMGDYVGLTSENPGVKNMVQRLVTNKPIESRPDDPGAGFIFRQGIESAMDHEAPARRLTLALAGRARIVAPALARQLDLAGAKRLLDVGGGTGLYAIACLRANPTLRAVVWDRAEVLKVAREMADKFGVSDRIELIPGDMFTSPIPTGCDVMLLSNILHDWDIPECQKLIDRCAGALAPGGTLLVHDVFLNDNLDGPLVIALYSTALFNITEGRAYSADEYRRMLRAAGLRPGDILPTAVNCGVMPAKKTADRPGT